ncbi:hypothetical protein FACS1894163_01540 [Spirochaetia bacterium]|nr:hypothetical protein FACS1894163_01540 [Spirochaetia bacterium]
MINQDRKDEIIRFVLDSSDEENENLAVFIAGIQAQERAFQRQKAGEENGAVYAASGPIQAAGE